MGDGGQWGLDFTYIEQPSPDGLAQAYLLAEAFLDGAPSAMVLGDNVFFGHGLPEMLATADAATVAARCSATAFPTPSAMAWWISTTTGGRAHHRETVRAALQLCRDRALFP